MRRTDALALVAIVGLSVATIAQHLTISKLQSQRPFLPSDRKAIEVARSMFKKETGSADEDVRNRFPVVIRFGNVRCVALMIPRGYIGRTPVYCFGMDYRQVRTVSSETPEVVDTRPESYGAEDNNKNLSTE